MNAGRVNEAEKAVAEYLLEVGEEEIFTFDQQLIPFLPEAVDYQLYEYVPSQVGDTCPAPFSFSPQKCTMTYVEGVYGRTEFNPCLEWHRKEMFGVFDTVTADRNGYAAIRIVVTDCRGAGWVGIAFVD